MKKEEDIKNIKELKKYLKEWTREKQNIKLSEKQFKSIFDLAENLGINTIGKMTIFYTLDIMPILEKVLTKDVTDSDEWYEAMKERNFMLNNASYKIRELIEKEKDLHLLKEKIVEIILGELINLMGKLTVNQLGMIYEEGLKEKKDKEEELASWCYLQDMLWRKGKLSKDKVDKLNKIGFPFGTYFKEVNKK